MFPKMGPLWKQAPISRALLGIYSGVPSKGALPLGSPHKDALIPELSFICLSMSSLVNKHNPGCPTGHL